MGFAFLIPLGWVFQIYWQFYLKVTDDVTGQVKVSKVKIQILTICHRCLRWATSPYQLETKPLKRLASCLGYLGCLQVSLLSFGLNSRSSSGHKRSKCEFLFGCCDACFWVRFSLCEGENGVINALNGPNRRKLGNFNGIIPRNGVNMTEISHFVKTFTPDIDTIDSIQNIDLCPFQAQEELERTPP